MVFQADDSIVCLGAKPDKGFWTCDLDVTGGGEGTPVWEWDKGTEKMAVGEGQRRSSRYRTPEHRGESVWERVQTSERRSSRHSSSFVEVSLESTLALVCTCTMLQNSPFALELTPSVLFVCSLSSRSLDFIWCSGKEMCVTPIGTTGWSPVVKKWNGSKSWCVCELKGSITLCLKCAAIIKETGWVRK